MAWPRVAGHRDADELETEDCYLERGELIAYTWKLESDSGSPAEGFSRRHPTPIFTKPVCLSANPMLLIIPKKKKTHRTNIVIQLKNPPRSGFQLRPAPASCISIFPFDIPYWTPSIHPPNCPEQKTIPTGTEAFEGPGSSPIPPSKWSRLASPGCFRTCLSYNIAQVYCHVLSTTVDYVSHISISHVEICEHKHLAACQTHTHTHTQRHRWRAQWPGTRSYKWLSNEPNVHIIP